MRESAKIKEHYIEAPLVLLDTEWEKRQGRASKLSCAFEVKMKIWLDQNLPEYRIAIPENLSHRSEQLEHWSMAYPIETRFITYKPTGRVVYDNTKPHREAVVFEYRFVPLCTEMACYKG